MGEPQIRAAQTRSLLATVRRQPEPVRARILALVSPADIERAEGMLGLGWAPMSLHMRLSDAIREVVGPQRNVEVWRETMVGVFESPFLRGFVDLTTNLFGISPHALLRRGEPVYQHITRDLGELVVEPDGGRATVVTLRGFPARAFQFICYVEGLEGCLLACFDVLRVPGKATVERVDDAAGLVRYRLESV